MALFAVVGLELFAHAQAPSPAARATEAGLLSAARVALDRVVVRFDAPETGGVSRPLFIFERELAFEARIEALGDGERAERSAVYLPRHVRAAIERHVAEELLAHLAMDPEPTAAQMARRAATAQDMLAQRVGGEDKLRQAAADEGIEPAEADAMVLREARASLYLDRMVAPMLEPSELELREVHRSGANPFRGQRFDEVLPVLRRWYISRAARGSAGRVLPECQDEGAPDRRAVGSCGRRELAKPSIEPPRSDRHRSLPPHDDSLRLQRDATVLDFHGHRQAGRTGRARTPTAGPHIHRRHDFIRTQRPDDLGSTEVLRGIIARGLGLC